MAESLLARLESLSRDRADRVLRLRGTLPGPEREPFELLVFRGFSCSLTHPTAFDPDRSALPDGAVISEAELLQGPLNPADEQVMAGPLAAKHFLDPAHW